MPCRDSAGQDHRKRIGWVARWLAVAIPLAGLQTFPLSLITTTKLAYLLARFIPEPPWIRPPSGCMGGPLGTPDEKALELSTRIFQATLLYVGTFIALLAVTTIVCGFALHRGRRRELRLLTFTAWATIASITANAAFVTWSLRHAM